VAYIIFIRIIHLYSNSFYFMFIFKFIKLNLNDSEHNQHEFIALHTIIYAELVKY